MLKESFSIFKKDKIVMLCSFIPIVIGLLLYFFLGSWLYNDVMSVGNEYLKAKAEGWIGALSFLFGALLMVGFYFVVNWTFVLVVSLMASPLNDLISTRVERLKRGQALPNFNESLSEITRRFAKMIKNEIKKILFVILLSIMAFGFSFIFPPIGYALSSVLVAISFVDYSWARHDLPFRSCFNDYRKAFFRYSFGGALFALFFGIPIVNLISYPIAVIYFTLQYVKSNP